MTRTTRLEEHPQVSDKLLEPDWRNEERKTRRNMLAQKDRNNTAAWRIDSREKLLTEIDKDPDGVLAMVLDMRAIYTKYLNQANEVDEQRN